MAIHRRVGEKLYLTLQLADRATTKRVFVELMDDTDTIVVSLFEILHVTNGIYRESTQVMPGTEMLRAFYYVYESDGVTLDTGYTTAEEVYVRLEPVIVSESIVGTIEEASISGSILEASLSATIDAEDILNGSINQEQELIGEICNEC